MFASYNLGDEKFQFGTTAIKVSDGAYHVIRFSRSGKNATLQVDLADTVTHSPYGNKLEVFNYQSMITIGGGLTSSLQRKGREPRQVAAAIELPYRGFISGLVFNDLRMLELAAEGDPRITFTGDVR